MTLPKEEKVAIGNLEGYKRLPAGVTDINDPCRQTKVPCSFRKQDDVRLNREQTHGINVYSNVPVMCWHFRSMHIKEKS